MAMKLHELVSVEDIGDNVYCDYCSTNYKGRADRGGFLFQSKACCPECAPNMLRNIRRYNETHFIRGHCPVGMSFHAWVMQLRGGDNAIRVYDMALDDAAGAT